nr:uncharacterized protein LOC109783153 [Aegilops tauschii subsp. strangulata]
MASWRDMEDNSEEEQTYTDMDVDVDLLLLTECAIVDTRLCSDLVGRTFIRSSTFSDLLLGGIDCEVIQWVDGPWLVILQRCPTKLWEMFHDQNCGRVMDRQAYGKTIDKLEKQNKFLANQFSDMVEEVGQLFDWQDGKVQHMEHENATKHAEDVKTKLAELEEQCKMELKMEKLRLAKEQRCILSSQVDIIRNTRKAMKEVKEDRDLLREEKKNLESVIAEFLKGGHGSKEKLQKIKSILEE